MGLEDGKVYKCSKAYSVHYLDVYEVQIHPFTVCHESFKVEKSVVIESQISTICNHTFVMSKQINAKSFHSYL